MPQVDLDLAAVDAAATVEVVEVDTHRPLERLLRDRCRAGHRRVDSDLDRRVSHAGRVAGATSAAAQNINRKRTILPRYFVLTVAGTQVSV